MGSESLYKQLVTNLEEIIKAYRGLLAVVRQEREILISSDLDALNENNAVKEKVLVEARSLERQRQLLTKEFVSMEKINPEELTLLSIAKSVDGERAEKFRSLHAVLDLLLKRVRDINAENEKLVHSALNNITGAMNSIKEMLDENKTYQKKGTVEQKPTQSGQLVSKQV